ncbi:hypothetical protein LTR28_001742 [Elasticomyces elasticus]|nr:hypothetical protein LTR28_001742 [Elasticomyces elasticus]
MPRLVRRAPVLERIKAYLNPWDFLLWLSEELSDETWDETLKDWAIPISLACNFVFLIARANSTGSLNKSDDVFAEYDGRKGNPKPSVTVVTTILLGVLLSVQLSFMQRSFSQQTKDTALIHKEVLHEYDTKFVHPSLNKPVRDVGIQTPPSSRTTPERARGREVDVYTPTTIVNRGFRTNPNPNYAAQYDPDGLAASPQMYVSKSTGTPALKTPNAVMNGSNGYTAPQSAYVSSHADFSSPLKPHHQRERSPMKGEGGSLGVYTHAASPLRRATSTNILRAGGQEGRRERHAASPLKRTSTPGGEGFERRFGGLRESRRDTGLEESTRVQNGDGPIPASSTENDPGRDTSPRKMPFSHHSHSGQFCGHAKNTLEEMVQAAIDKGMTTFALTEHMPRDVEDLYPEEDTTAEGLVRLHDDFHAEATRLRQKYASQIRILIGFETEWIRPSSLPLINTLLGKHDVDLFIGSVHHVHAIPIDFDHDMYYKARQKAGGSDERIFEEYFDSQYAMLQALKPPVVGHFDLIRLKSDSPDRGFEQWPMVWSKILRNLELIASYGGILELNSSALRKGMSEPYPQISICKVSLWRKL